MNITAMDSNNRKALVWDNIPEWAILAKKRLKIRNL